MATGRRPGGAAAIIRAPVKSLLGGFVLAAASLARAQDAPPAPSAPAPTFAFRVALSDLEPLRDRDDRKAELFFVSARAAWERDGWGARAELRGSEERFRPYYPGQVWLEEGYAYYLTPLGEARAGKLPRDFGLADETFGGTLFSLLGVTRNPDFGLGLAGHRDLGHDTLAWTLLWLGRNDHVAWELDGRGVESDPLASLRDAFAGRVAYRRAVDFPWLVVTPALSAESARIVREGGLPEFRRTDVALDVTGAVGPISLGLEGLVRSGESAPPSGVPSRLGYGDGRAFMASFRAEFPNVVWRYVYSEWRYADADANERQHLASSSWSPRKGVEGTIEFTSRRLREGASARAFNAFRFGLCLTF